MFKLHFVPIPLCCTAKAAKAKAAKEAAKAKAQEPKSTAKSPTQATPFNLFVEARRPRVLAANPDARPSEVRSLLSAAWKKMDKNEKKPWTRKAEKVNSERAAAAEKEAAEEEEEEEEVKPVGRRAAAVAAAAAAAAEDEDDEDEEDD